MELPTLDHPGWGRLLAVVATGQGPRPVQQSRAVVRDEKPSAAHDRAKDGGPSTSDIHA